MEEKKDKNLKEYSLVFPSFFLFFFGADYFGQWCMIFGWTVHVTLIKEKGKK